MSRRSLWDSARDWAFQIPMKGNEIDEAGLLQDRDRRFKSP